MIEKTGTVTITEKDIVAEGFHINYTKRESGTKEILVWAKNKLDKALKDETEKIQYYIWTNRSDNNGWFRERGQGLTINIDEAYKYSYLDAFTIIQDNSYASMIRCDHVICE